MTTRLRTAAALTAACLVLAACGGGGGDDTAAELQMVDPPALPMAPVHPPPATPGESLQPQQPQVPAAGACGNAQELQQLLDALNAARAQARLCSGKQKPAVSPLKWSAALAQAAERHSRDMVAHNFAGHTGSDGSTFTERIRDAGYTGAPLSEDVAAGRAAAASAVQQWLESTAGHCDSVMDAKAVDVGGACAYGASTTYRYYWTLDLGRP